MFSHLATQWLCAGGFLVPLPGGSMPKGNSGNHGTAKSSRWNVKNKRVSCFDLVLHILGSKAQEADISGIVGHNDNDMAPGKVVATQREASS
jgi:hypothetical protein